MGNPYDGRGEYEVRIARRIANPNYREDSSLHQTSQRFIEQDVTIVTLDAEQWKAVQAAIVEALR